MSRSRSVAAEPRDFIREIVARDLAAGRAPDGIVTRFPPEPNGFLHIGHAKSICLNFGIANEADGRCNLRFDDTNPHTEDIRYVEAIESDVRWLGFEWNGDTLHASDYFEALYGYATVLIEKARAYVDSQSEDEIREGRGSVTEPGTNSPFRDRSVSENLDLFRRMRDGEFGDGAHVLRARIDMAHKNMVMRDPVLYRIRHAHHYRTGDSWCLYPLYDFTHGLSDAIEGVTHSLCTLEFENNRELYDWILDEVGIEEPRPHQYEFARLNLDYTVMSKRKLLRLVNDGHVDGWDDPRMPTISGLRRRGVTPEAIRAFCDMIGVTRADNRIDVGKLEFAIRDDLNTRVPRVLCVVDPVKVVIANYPEDEVEWLEAPLYPRDVPLEGSRKLPFSRELLIDRDDVHEDPPEGFHRLAPGREVRLRYGYFITLDDVVKDEAGRIVELRCTYDPATRGGDAPDGRSPRGTLHWVSAEHAVPCELRLYDRLFNVPDPEDVPEDGDITDHLNPDSLVVAREAVIEPSVADDPPATRYQFERVGYFIREDADGLVFNRTVTLRDSWGKRAGEAEQTAERAAGDAMRESVPETVHDPVAAALARERSGDEAARFDRYVGWGVPVAIADGLAGSAELGGFFEAALTGADGDLGAAEDGLPASLANWVSNDVRRVAGSEGVVSLTFSPADLRALVGMVEAGEVPRHRAREVFDRMVATGDGPRAIVAGGDFGAGLSEAELNGIIDQVLAAHPDEVAEYRGGKVGLLGFFIGRVMRATGGKADPSVVRRGVAGRLG